VRRPDTIALNVAEFKRVPALKVETGEARRTSVSMSNFLSQLTTSERARLLEELNYMNLEEIRGFCSARAIPYRIVAESSNGKVKATKDTDRKPIVLARVRRYLRTGRVGQPFPCRPRDEMVYSNRLT